MGFPPQSPSPQHRRLLQASLPPLPPATCPADQLTRHWLTTLLADQLAAFPGASLLFQKPLSASAARCSRVRIKGDLLWEVDPARLSVQAEPRPGPRGCGTSMSRAVSTLLGGGPCSAACFPHQLVLLLAHGRLRGAQQVWGTQELSNVLNVAESHRARCREPVDGGRGCCSSACWGARRLRKLLPFRKPGELGLNAQVSAQKRAHVAVAGSSSL